MPCFDPTDRDPSPEQLLAAKMPAVLCGLVSKLGDVAVLNTVDWSKAGVRKEEFQKWWELHKVADTAKEETKKHKYQMYYSERGIPLLYVGKPRNVPVVTMENYTKWYDIYLVMPGGAVCKVNVDDISAIVKESKINLRIDHLYHPRLLYLLGIRLNATVDERAVEVTAGRWIIEAIDEDPNNFDRPKN